MLALLACLATHYVVWNVPSLVYGEMYLFLWQVFIFLLPYVLRQSYEDGGGGWRLYRAPFFLGAAVFRSQSWFHAFQDWRVVVAERGSLATDETVNFYAMAFSSRRDMIRCVSAVCELTGFSPFLFFVVSYDLWCQFIPFPAGVDPSLVLCWGRDLSDCGEVGYALHEGRRVTNALSPGEGDLLSLPKDHLYLLKEVGGATLAVPLSKGRAATGADDECVVCRDHGRDYCCLPCGHYCLCGECAPNLHLCPKCACPVTRFQRVWA